MYYKGMLFYSGGVANHRELRRASTAAAADATTATTTTNGIHRCCCYKGTAPLLLLLLFIALSSEMAVSMVTRFTPAPAAGRDRGNGADGGIVCRRGCTRTTPGSPPRVAARRPSRLSTATRGCAHTADTRWTSWLRSPTFLR